MAVILYKPGDTVEVRGIRCDLVVMNEYSFMHMLESGWHLSPEECYAEVVEDIEVEMEPETEIEPEVEPAPVVDKKPKKEKHPQSDEEIALRALAKEKGIRNWHNKKLDKIRKELEDLKNGEPEE